MWNDDCGSQEMPNAPPLPRMISVLLGVEKGYNFYHLHWEKCKIMTSTTKTRIVIVLTISSFSDSAKSMDVKPNQILIH